MRYLFDLDRRTLIFCRFFVESFAILFVYLLWSVSLEGDEQFSVATHFINASIWVLTYKYLGLHKDRLRFSNLKSYMPIVKASIFFGFILAAESLLFFGTLEVIHLLFFVLASLNLLLGLRISTRQLIRREYNKKRSRILVYGTSDGAIDLMNAMAFGKKYHVVGFISDTPENIGSLSGLPVIRISDVGPFSRTHNCKLVVIANSLEKTSLQKDVLLKLDKLGLSVSYAPTLDRAFNYEVQLKSIKPEEVLGRESSVQFDESVSAEIDTKTVLVTGAGGSIGSEICRQILRYQPAKIVILEISEFALYTIEQELSEFASNAETKFQVCYYLGSITDEVILHNLFKEHKIDIVYHAAAYKHVPIVEENICAGISNNVFGTKLLAECAQRYGVDKFVLVSTDKAVRPTNVMGASKRLAELIIQDLAKTSNTVFTMVRFGNVLGSSGSVIPKFKSQINAGGPITVTHAEITRYFMSIPEAAHLVITAGTLASGGEVFLLDMGDPVKIVELAKTMVRQHGLRPVTVSEIPLRQQADDEILIEFVGLRPGEKLYEELLVDGIANATQNPKIFKSYDGVLDDLDLPTSLQKLEKNIQYGCREAILQQLRELPISFQTDTLHVSERPCAVEGYSENAVTRENTDGQQFVTSPLTDYHKPTLFQKLAFSRLSVAILHRYFLLRRGLTLGVRILVKNHKEEILLVRHTYMPGWHLPGGGVDPGEAVEAAAMREVYEETGVAQLKDLKFMGVYANTKMSKRDHVIYFTGTTEEQMTNTKSFEIAEARFVHQSQINELLSIEELNIFDLRSS